MIAWGELILLLIQDFVIRSLEVNCADQIAHKKCVCVCVWGVGHISVLFYTRYAQTVLKSMHI